MNDNSRTSNQYGYDTAHLSLYVDRAKKRLEKVLSNARKFRPHNFEQGGLGNAGDESIYQRMVDVVSALSFIEDLLNIKEEHTITSLYRTQSYNDQLYYGKEWRKVFDSTGDRQGKIPTKSDHILGKAVDFLYSDRYFISATEEAHAIFNIAGRLFDIGLKIIGLYPNKNGSIHLSIRRREKGEKFIQPIKYKNKMSSW